MKKLSVIFFSAPLVIFIGIWFLVTSVSAGEIVINDKEPSQKELLARYLSRYVNDLEVGLNDAPIGKIPERPNYTYCEWLTNRSGRREFLARHLEYLASKVRENGLSEMFDCGEIEMRGRKYANGWWSTE